LKSFFYIFIILTSVSFSGLNAHSGESNIYLKYHLAISINPGSNSGYVNYAIIGENNGKLVYTKFITCTEFILIGMGRQFSAANDSAVNIFKYFNIKDCLYKYDSSDCKKKKPEPKLFDLWSLRYNRNPFCPPDCVPSDNMLIEGFGQYRSRPSWPQIQILQKYGITYINDFFYGEKLFQLLSDFQKPEWRQQYADAID